MKWLFSFLEKYNIDRTVFKNSIWIMIRNVATLLLATGVSIIGARLLGDYNWGIYNYGLSLLNVSASVCLFGLGTSLSKMLVQHREQQPEILRAAKFLRFALALIGGGVIFVLLYLGEGKEYGFVIALSYSLSVLFQGYTLDNEWFIANEKSKYYSYATIIASVVSSIWKLFVLFCIRNLELFCAGVLIENIVIFIISNIYVRKGIARISKLSAKWLKKVFSDSWVYAIGDISVVFYIEIDKLIIEKLMNYSDVGVYSVGLSYANLWVFIPMSIYYSSKPGILGNWEGKGKAKLKTLTKQLLLISIVAAALSSLFGRLIIGILYGEQYIGAYKIAGLLNIAMIFSVCGCIGSVWLMGENLERFMTYRTVMGAILNVFLDIILIKKYGGVGAGFATAISYFCVSILFLTMHPKTIGFFKLYFRKE